MGKSGRGGDGGEGGGVEARDESRRITRGFIVIEKR